VISFKCALECAEWSFGGSSTDRIGVSYQSCARDWEVRNESRTGVKIKDVVQCWFAPLHKLRAKYT
jgi:hypothetical protein